MGVGKMNREKADEWGPLAVAAGEGKRGTRVNSTRLTRSPSGSDRKRAEGARASLGR